MTRITGHIVIIHKAFSMYEQGVHYDLEPWGGNGLYYQGESSPVEFDLDTGLRVAERFGGGLMIYGHPDGPLTLQEAFILGVARPVEPKGE